MHYTQKQCSRAAIEGVMCKQHSQMKQNFILLDWHEFVERGGSR